MLSIICVVQCRVVEYVLISKDNDDQIVTGGSHSQYRGRESESAVQWLVHLVQLHSPLTE